jgi:hypothetical protein
MIAFEGYTFFGEGDRYAASCHFVPIGWKGITFLFIHDQERKDRDGLPLLLFAKDIADLVNLADAQRKMAADLGPAFEQISGAT